MAPPAQEKLRDRAAFYAAIAKVKDGMTPKQVEKILGRPDDVRGPSDPTDQSDVSTSWRYGTDKHLGLATLGWIEFRDGKASWRSWPGTKPFKPLMPEAELREILRKIAPRPRVGPEFDPLWVVRSANVLQALGRKRALYVLEQFCSIGADSRCPEKEAYGLVQVLFEDPSSPKANNRPYSPLVVVNDIPFNYFRPMGFAGERIPPSEAVEYYQSHGKFLDHQLKPPADPFATELKMRTSPAWLAAVKQKGADYAAETASTQRDVLALVLSVVPDLGGTYWDSPQRFEEGHKTFQLCGGKWDEPKGIYVREDGVGSILDVPLYPVIQWNAGKLPPLKLELIAHRQDTERVEYTINYSGSDKFNHDLKLRVIDASSKQVAFEQTEQIQKDQNPTIPGANNGAIGSGFQLGVGALVYLELSSGKNTLRSPVYEL